MQNEATAARTADAASVSVHADGQLTSLLVHLREGTGLSVHEYPAEGRAVLTFGGALPDVDVFVPSVAVLARLIDVLNESYTRLTSPARVATLRCAPSQPAGAPRRPRMTA